MLDIQLDEYEQVKERYARALASSEAAEETAAQFEISSEVLGDYLDEQLEEADGWFSQVKILTQMINEQTCLECANPAVDDDMLEDDQSVAQSVGNRSGMESPMSMQLNRMSDAQQGVDEIGMMQGDSEHFHFSIKQSDSVS